MRTSHISFVWLALVACGSATPAAREIVDPAPREITVVQPPPMHVLASCEGGPVSLQYFEESYSHRNGVDQHPGAVSTVMELELPSRPVPTSIELNRLTDEHVTPIIIFGRDAVPGTSFRCRITLTKDVTTNDILPNWLIIREYAEGRRETPSTYCGPGIHAWFDGREQAIRMERIGTRCTFHIDERPGS